jgi:GT2 family glycosyltransferase
MSGLARMRAIKSRLTAAIRRHGLATVLKVVAGSLLRHGLTVTLRMSGAQRPFPWQGRPVAGRREAGPADLDAAYTLDRAAWARWRDILGPAPSRDDTRIDPLRLLFVLRGPEPSPGDRDRTLAAIAALGPEAACWTSGSPDSGVAFVVFLQPGDLPFAELPRALGRAARGGVAEVLTFDMIRPSGDRVQPLLLPGVNPTLLDAVDYVFSRMALAPALLSGHADLEAVDPRAQVLLWLQAQPARQARGRWRHVGQPLVEAAVTDGAVAALRREAIERSRSPAPDYGGEPVSVIICTKDKGHLTRQLVRGLLASDPALVGEVIIVSNNTGNPYALATLEDLALSPRVRVLRRDEPFNFSKLCNAGARHSQGRGPLLFLNDDVAPVSEDWLHRLAVRLDDPAVGSVGALLLYPDESVQHAGIYLGYKGGAGHILRHARLPDDDYLFTACAPREVSALTGAVLLTRRADFEALNGFDEQLALAFQDVDYGLRLKAIGRLNVFEPAAILVHMESASVKSLGAGIDIQRRRQAERMRYVERWGALLQNDPLHPRGFDIEDETLRRLKGPGGLRPSKRG